MTRTEIYALTENAALHLPEKDRARLVSSLLASLHSDDPEVDAAWLDEAEIRDEALESGDDRGLDPAGLFRKLRSALQ